VPYVVGILWQVDILYTAAIVKKFLVIFTLLIPLVQLVNTCCRKITVSTNGNDTEDCLEGDYPCSSLGYVLNH